MKILGIELGSTRIKAVLIDENANVIASGVSEWENELVDGFWSYPLTAVKNGMQEAYANLIKNYGQPLTTVDRIGISAMMHGHLAFDKYDNLLVPFRTWRNTNASKASEILSPLLSFNVPMRWSVAQYFQAVLNNEEHVKKIAHLNTLSGYVHYLLTGKRVLGMNDASGIFPLAGLDYDQERLEKFDTLLASYDIMGNFKDLLPSVLPAGAEAGTLTEEGAKWLDPTGNLQPGIVFCPPEGDMGTGIVATGCVAPLSGNISSGTSANLTIVLEKPLRDYYKELDVIATPDGYPAIIIHTNNCTNEINAWVNVFDEALSLFGVKVDKTELFTKLFNHALTSDEKVGGMSGYNFLAGEGLAGTDLGAPLLVRGQEGKLTLANLMQTQIYSAIATLALGVDILDKEGIKIKNVLAHGGYYKTPIVGQSATSAILKTPVTVMNTSSEGGAWGMALLALYSTQNSTTLSGFLDKIFASAQKSTLIASEEEQKKCDEFIKNYKKYLSIAQTASKLQ